MPINLRFQTKHILNPWRIQINSVEDSLMAFLFAIWFRLSLTTTFHKITIFFFELLLSFWFWYSNIWLKWKDIWSWRFKYFYTPDSLSRERQDFDEIAPSLYWSLYLFFLPIWLTEARYLFGLNSLWKSFNYIIQ